MDRSIEFLISSNRNGGPMIDALYSVARGNGRRAWRTKSYEGKADILVLYGVGAPERAAARRAQIERGGHAVLWDLGYFGRAKHSGNLRVSIDGDHPHALLDATPEDKGRWDSLGIRLREDAKPDGHIVLVGLGPKSRSYLGAAAADWERRKLDELKARFPSRRIVYRPKPRRAALMPLKCETDSTSAIEELLCGAALVVCRHSNVAVDAALAGVPFECEDGAALWLSRRAFTAENRMSFLRRLAMWQWRAAEATEAWAFLMRMIDHVGRKSEDERRVLPAAA